MRTSKKDASARADRHWDEDGAGAAVGALVAPGLHRYAFPSDATDRLATSTVSAPISAARFFSCLISDPGSMYGGHE